MVVGHQLLGLGTWNGESIDEESRTWKCDFVQRFPSMDCEGNHDYNFFEIKRQTNLDTQKEW